MVSSDYWIILREVFPFANHLKVPKPRKTASIRYDDAFE